MGKKANVDCRFRRAETAHKPGYTVLIAKTSPYGSQCAPERIVDMLVKGTVYAFP
jgi:hypothetical protein